MNLADFVQNIEFYCKRKGIKQTIACRESGAGERLLENMKRGSVPSVEKVQMLAQYLGVTVSELLGEVTPQAQAPQGLANLAPEALAIAEAYTRADGHIKSVVNTALAPYKIQFDSQGGK